ncbi:MAG: AFG1/ZapE family ATPase, partial [Nitrosomonas sp.]|nr:AFG1/ZapE family ATPase [Nitrosomonas sp.]
MTHNKSPQSEYQMLMQEGELKPDPDQASAIIELERLYCELTQYPEIKIRNNATPKKNSWLSRLFKHTNKDKKFPKSIYLYGGVGRGKSMLMDLFYSVAPLKS